MGTLGHRTRMRFLSARRREQLADVLLANATLVLVILASIAAAVPVHGLSDSRLVRITGPLLLGALAVTALAVGLYPGTSWAALGLARRRTPDVLRGLLLGAAGCGLVAGIAVLAQWAGPAPLEPGRLVVDWRDALWAGVAVLTVGALGEEMFLRGLVLQFLARAMGPAVGVAATALVFALLHGGNPGTTLIAQANTALFGMVFGLAVLRHRSLWLAAGLHLGWNLAQVCFGFNTSGITIRLTGLNMESRSVAWVTGGAYGLEGGVLATGAALLLAAALWLLPRPKLAAPMLWEQQSSQAGNRRGPVLGLGGGASGGGGTGCRESRQADGRPAR